MIHLWHGYSLGPTWHGHFIENLKLISLFTVHMNAGSLNQGYDAKTLINAMDLEYWMGLIIFIPYWDRLDLGNFHHSF